MINVNLLDNNFINLVSPIEINQFSRLGFTDATVENTICFVNEESRLQEAFENPNIDAIIISSTFCDGIEFQSQKKMLMVNNPIDIFFNLQKCTLPKYTKTPTKIHSSAYVSDLAKISEVGVEIGSGTVIGDFVSISAGVSVGEGCNISEGARIGVEGVYLLNSNSNQKLSLPHKGNVKIGDNVFIGANVTIARSIFDEESTFINNFNFIDSGTYISHGVHIGSNNHIATNVNISGYTKIGNYNWIGPSSVFSHKLTIGSRNYISIGSTVLQDIESDWKIASNRIFKDRKLP